MKLNIHKETDVIVPRKRLNDLFKFVAGGETKQESNATVNLIFTTNKRMKQLNQNFRGKGSSTDVLSFNIDNSPDSQAIFGEVYISVGIAKKQAADYNVVLSQELLRLACHGFLHLCGHDHINERESKIMFALQEKYLSRVIKRPACD